MDLYSLYRGVDSSPTTGSFVKDVTMLQVDEILNPEEWLSCVKWCRYRHLGGDSKSLELFVARPTRSGFYYSVGEDGALLVSHENPNHSIKIHKETVETMTGESAEYCLRPTIMLVDRELSEQKSEEIKK